MKKLLAVLLAAAMMLALLGVTASAEPEAPKNYLEGIAWDTRFAGTMEVTEEDGVKVYTYTPKSPAAWMAPTISIYQAFKELIGEEEDAEIVLSFEVRGIFKEEGDSASARALLRAVNPKNGGFSFPGDDPWDNEDNYWSDLYDEATDGERLFGGPSSGNVMKSGLATVEILDDEWTLVETDEIYITGSNIQDSLFADWVLTMDNIQTYDAESLISIQVRNAAMYNYEEWAEAFETPEPTPEPTPVPTATPEPTDAPEATDAPTPEVTDEAPATDNGSEPGGTDTTGGDNTALIVGIICGVVVIGAVVAFLIIKKKKQ